MRSAIGGFRHAQRFGRRRVPLSRRTKRVGNGRWSEKDTAYPGLRTWVPPGLDRSATRQVNGRTEWARRCTVTTDARTGTDPGTAFAIHCIIVSDIDGAQVVRSALSPVPPHRSEGGLPRQRLAAHDHSSRSHTRASIQRRLAGSTMTAATGMVPSQADLETARMVRLDFGLSAFPHPEPGRPTHRGHRLRLRW